MDNNFKSSEIFSRTVLLLGNTNFEKLKRSHVLVVGLGGVGGYALEQIVRAGIGKVTVIDSDIINASNINRQIIAHTQNIGNLKTEQFVGRIKKINPDIVVNALNSYFTENEFVQLFSENNFDYVIDAIDTLAPKTALLKYCVQNNIKVVSSMGAAGKIDITAVKVSDVEQSYNCSLARFVRKRLHKFGIRSGFKVVFSSEITPKEVVVPEKSLNKNTNAGSVSYMPAVFGLYCAWVVISDLISQP